MQIQLNGYDGIFEVYDDKYSEFQKILNIGDDLLLDLINFPAVSILSINNKDIINEGLIPLSHISTDIGKKRMKELIDNKIIKRLK